MSSIYKSFSGFRVIVRAYSAGLFVGTLVEFDDKNVLLKDCRRLWRWHTANNGLSISEIGQYGINQEKSKICCIEEWKILPYVEISPVCEKAYISIMTAPEYIYNSQDKPIITNSGAGNASADGDGNGGGEGHGTGACGYGSGGGLGRGSACGDGQGDGSGNGESSSDSD
jgi:hypothetical protein